VLGATAVFAWWVWRENMHAATAATMSGLVSGSPGLDRLRIIITFLQIIAAVATSFTAVQWPENFQDATGVLTLLGMNPAIVVGPSCIDQSFTLSAGDSYLINLLLPLVLTGIA